MMIFLNCRISDVVIHRIGNKFEEGELEISEHPFSPEDEDLVTLMKDYFLSPFKREAYYNFVPIADEYINNPVYQAVDMIFSEKVHFYAQSIKIAEHLFEQSNQPDIKQGDLYVTYFSDIQTDDGTCDAVGIFKAETKDTFIKVFMNQGNTYQMQPDAGINIKKLDKCCLIFNVNRENGYKVLIANKSNAKEAVYWQNDFLGLQPADDSYFQTTNYMNLCKDFVRDIYNNENDVSKTDQIDMLNRSMDFFKQTELFSEDSFIHEVVQQPEVIKAFENFKQQYVQTNQVPLTNAFQISDYAVKDEKKYFKHVLKLDKNFHIYIHGLRKYIEKGYDTAKDMSFYKLFFREEE
ncbi:hypothetical protein FACS1894199_11310 [Bacteroidia bacterium]|nr:hypothetical protein FACS1894199_11310 [Bacteroidia bacterium]